MNEYSNPKPRQVRQLEEIQKCNEAVLTMLPILDSCSKLTAMMPHTSAPALSLELSALADRIADMGGYSRNTGLVWDDELWPTALPTESIDHHSARVPRGPGEYLPD